MKYCHRMIVARILEFCSDRSSQAIIDIGAWIGDNSLVWAKMVKKYQNWRIIAIDPSSRNISFIKKVADFNLLDNIQACQYLCSDEEGLSFNIQEGNINHGSFKAADASSLEVTSSTTLNKVFCTHGSEYSLLLMHLDVEGQELNVLLGANKLLDKFCPFIVYEGHIKKDAEVLDEIQNILVGRGYSIWMINEILPGCRLDCRNFLATPPALALDLIDELQLAFYDVSGLDSFFPATTDQLALLKI